MKQQTSLLGKLKIVVLGFVVVAAWTYTIIPILDFFYGEPTFPSGNHSIDLKYYLFFVCLLVPLIEELKFRILPLTFARFFDEGTDRLLWPTILATSLWFGFAHGRGIISLCVQGVHGVVFAYVYIKTNRTYWCSALLHAMYNVSCLYLY